MTASPTKDDLLNQIDALLWLHFPDDSHPNGPFWRQRPYLDDLFDLSIQAYGTVDRDDVAHHVRTHWNIRREHQLPPSDLRLLDELIDAWGDWQFAYRRLVEEKGRGE
jgi:hypothetical protein